ncbi:MAG TPA: response regulator [Acidimicrobiales bacterium]|nr:response regulator [Acidimicrobiales bacterium]
MPARPIRVMVVDDTPHVLRMLASMLEIDGFEVVSQATSGEEAIERLDEADPDVVVIDYKMPAMDGLTAARELRSRRPDQVVVLYTAYIDAALEREAAEVGVALCLDKIEGLASLEREISRLCTSLG